MGGIMKRISILLLVFFTCFALAAWSQAQPQWWHHKIITFDVPGAGTRAGQGTFGWTINPSAAIVGWYVDGGNVMHGFLRDRAGKFTMFDAPGEGTAAGQGTFPQNDNTAGAIAGYYVDANGVSHGFLR